ncbi:MAG: glycosyltransferase [Thermomicrobiales bacterium]
MVCRRGLADHTRTVQPNLAGSGGRSCTVQRSADENPARNRWVLGWVPDLEVIYRDADAVIIPLRAGGGTRIKLLEAAAHRRPVVTTTIGAEGIDVTNGRDCLIADNATDFAAACVRLANDPALAARLGRHGEDLVRSRYTLSAMIDALHPR